MTTPPPAAYTLMGRRDGANPTHPPTTTPIRRTMNHGFDPSN